MNGGGGGRNGGRDGGRDGGINGGREGVGGGCNGGLEGGFGGTNGTLNGGNGGLMNTSPIFTSLDSNLFSNVRVHWPLKTNASLNDWSNMMFCFWLFGI